jgi:hypothetical protein
VKFQDSLSTHEKLLRSLLRSVDTIMTLTRIARASPIARERKKYFLRGCSWNRRFVVIDAEMEPRRAVSTDRG